MAATLAGQVALVTGAGSGIGRASARALAREGARVVVADARADTLATIHDEIRAAGGEALAVPTDVSDPAAVEALVAAGLAAFGQIHILLNCAGISMRRPVLEMTDAEWHRVLGVNLHGTFYCCRAAGRHMAERGYGRIINLASDRATFGLVNGAHYATSKGGVIALTKSLALELGRSGVTVNAINPGTTDTPLARGTLSDEEWQSRGRQDPLGRFSTPEDIAQLVLFLAGTGGAFMTGQVVTVRMRFG
jgi:NAD(P)-dependent dehydrogenase (short-subunit alcohol dehydrogenase family)